MELIHIYEVGNKCKCFIREIIASPEKPSKRSFLELIDKESFRRLLKFLRKKFAGVIELGILIGNIHEITTCGVDICWWGS